MTRRGGTSGFSLLELSVVLIIIGLVTAMAMDSGRTAIATARENATREKLKAIEQALMAYRTSYNRLPCPASLTISEGATNFGVEGATPGTCTGGTPAANSSAAGVTNSGKTGVEGALPVATLGLPTDFMYDGWGRRFRYAVDKSATATGAFTSIKTACTDLAITVKDANGGNRTTGALYAVVSHGANGHGGYTKQGVIASAGSTNTDEQTNCHCNASAAATTYAPTYVQKDPTENASSATDSFDDMLTFAERWQMLASFEKPENCGGVEYIYVVDSGNNRIQKFDLSGNFVAKWGTTGSGNGQFDQPNSITVDANNGYLYVGEYWNDRIQKFDTDGNFVLKFGSYGSGNGQFNYVSDIAVDDSGNVYVGDRWNTRVQKFNSSGTYVTKWGTNGTGTGQFSNPDGVSGLTIYGNHIYVIDGNTKRVQKFDLSGSYVSQVYLNAATPTSVWPCASIDFDSAGNMYTGNCNWYEVSKLNNAGTTYLDNYSGYSNSGANGTQYNGGAFALDAGGNVWLSDIGNNRVQKFDSTGTWLLSIGGGVGHSCRTSPSGLPGCPAGSADGQFNLNGAYHTAIAIGP